MKRMLALILALTGIAAAIAGCGGVKKKDNRLSIVTTIYPEYDWVRNIAEDKADIIPFDNKSPWHFSNADLL